VCYDLNFPPNRISKTCSRTCARPAVFPYPPEKNPPREGQKAYKGGTSAIPGSFSRPLARCIFEYKEGAQGVISV
jgi:hypothetical protein